MSARAGPRVWPKHPGVTLCALVPWLLLVALVMWPWATELDGYGRGFSLMARGSAAVWALALLWTTHHLCFQLGALFRRGEPHPAAAASPGGSRPAVAVLYTTCDDFNEECCRSCLEQDYPRTRLYVCDDSRSPEYVRAVERFCEPRRLRPIRRPDRAGYKAGNLNHAIQTAATEEEWLLLVDADQRLERTYLSRMVSSLPAEEDVAFVQSAQTARAGSAGTPFQATLAPEVDMFYTRDLALRNGHGFVPLLGHGALVRRSAWQAAGRFPHVVSEDFAFAMACAERGMRGLYVEEVVGEEAYPTDFGAFTLRLHKFAGGTAQLAGTRSLRFFLGPSALVEKYDFTMQLFWYALMPLVVLNGFASAYVVHRLWTDGVRFLHPVLPYLYTLLVLALFGVVLSAVERTSRGVRFYCWATAVYAAAMPLAGWSFLKHLVVTPEFHRTPKNGERLRLRRSHSLLMLALGAAAVAASIRWVSPFTPVLLGQGLAYGCYPLYGHLASGGIGGVLARMAVYLPGALMLAAIAAMWIWAV